MTEMQAWPAEGVTIAILVLYEIALVLAQRLRPEQMARSAHARLRQEWFEAVSSQVGSEILAVQTLRNSMMSAMMMASTAALGLMGTATLAVPLMHAGLGDPPLTPRLVLEMVLMGQLFASLVSSAMSVRYFNHAGFITGIPAGSDARKHWMNTGSAYVKRAGILYSWSLRQLLLVAPLLVSLLHPLAGPPAALVVVGVVFAFDRFDPK